MSISNVNSRRSREERYAEQSTNREGKINQDIKEEPATTMSSTSLGILINAIVESPLNQLGIKVITAPIKWNRGGEDWGKCRGWETGVAEVPDKQISPGKTDNYPARWSR